MAVMTPGSDQNKIVTTANGRKVEVHWFGSGPELVWLHGPHGLRKGDEMIAALSRHFTVIAPLAPGFADVEELDEIRDVHDLALHYDDVMEALGLDQVRLVGTSFGAMIAGEVAAHVPSRVARLALISPFGLWDDEYPVDDLFARPYATIDTILWKDGAASGALADPANFPNDPVEQAVFQVQAMTAVAKFIWPIPDKGLGRRLYRVKADTLVVAGAEDQFVPSVYAGKFAEAIPNARSVIVSDAAHMVAYEKTDQVADLIVTHMLGK